jgi:hypothetical protein
MNARHVLGHVLGRVDLNKSRSVQRCVEMIRVKYATRGSSSNLIFAGVISRLVLHNSSSELESFQNNTKLLPVSVCFNDCTGILNAAVYTETIFSAR